MIVGDDELDAVEAAPAQSDKEVLPGGAAFPAGHFDGQDLAAPIPVYSDGDQHGLAHDYAALAHLLIPGVEDEVGERLGKGALGEGVKVFVQALVDGRNGGGREGVAAQLLGDRLDLAGRDALHVHLGQRRHQRLLGALVALEELGREPAVPILRHAQLELAHPCDERTSVVAGTVAEPGGRAFALPGPESVISASSISCITARTISRSPSGLCAKSSLTATIAGLPSVLVMAAFLTRQSGDLDITSLP